MKTPPICYIPGALPLPQNFTLSPAPDDLIIAADGGYTHLSKLGVVPDVIVGDFDSSPAPDYHPQIIKLPIEKDDTDMGYAIQLGLTQNFKHFVLLGGLGGLLDHTVANLQHLLSLSQQNCRGILVGDSQCATVITNGTLTLSGIPNQRCSIFAFGGNASGVTLKNLYYPIENAPLSPHFPLGVSNSFTQLPAEISVAQGSLLIIWETASSDVVSVFFNQ